MAKWDEIKQEWETTKITLAKLAEKHDVPLGTIKSQKSRDSKNGNPWTRDATEKDATKTKKVATIKEDATDVSDDGIDDDGLTDKQREFCLHYVRTHNATQSAIMAGYAKNSAYAEGSRLLRNVKVSEEIKRLKAPMIEATYVEATDFIQLLVKIAFADIGDFVKGGGFDIELKPVDEIDTSVLSELSNTENGIKIKMENKMKAIEMLAKHSDILKPNEQERLKLQQMQLNIDKTKAEIEKLDERGDGPIEIIIKRKGEG
ncbi:terminase small subunit [Lysinibacillus fusiformis]|uniref:terminase small subunit n=1 Tax=Lysinibacillus fusiformis TaxID=28031 RepID=UPI002EA4EE6B|nr:terminase small subunit [Lysinibacillus fusiformis]